MLKQRDMIKQRIGALVAGDGTLEVIIQELTRMRDEGVDRQQVVSTCQELREEADEDLILEVLDIVTGWCSPCSRIWDD